MEITVILCTYQRCNSLARALQSVAGSTLPSAVKWEVLVVDNNSSDQTRQVVEEISRRYPGRFRYLFEPQPGKSHALNAGIRHARGEILAFMDDDVTVEPTWLESLTSALHDQEWAGAGGRILPEWPCELPRWLSPDDPYAVGYTLALFDRGLKAGDLTEPPFGTNMAFRKAIFEKFGGFKGNLGPRPCNHSLQRGEDSEFGQRLLAAGERLRYEPSAVVYHWVPEERLQKKYFLAWSFGHGRSYIRAFGVAPEIRWRVWGIPLYLFRRLAAWTVRWMIAIDPLRRFDAKLKIWAKVGEILECYRLAHGERQQKVLLAEVRGPDSVPGDRREVVKDKSAGTEPGAARNCD